MTATQSLKLFHIAQRYFNNTEDASAFVAEIETVVEDKIEAKKSVLATKDDLYSVKENLKQEINALRVEMKDQKAEIIKWMFIFWIGQITATIGIILLFVKK